MKNWSFSQGNFLEGIIKRKRWVIGGKGKKQRKKSRKFNTWFVGIPERPRKQRGENIKKVRQANLQELKMLIKSAESKDLLVGAQHNKWKIQYLKTSEH